ncbi:hypothetical protein HAX54_011031 [Datura stramonium]|uniref:Uncharacterized protein n=1 Tax=Datura stramonium TaxID=4076 RepID=A0ABS8TIR5_DATST|nr:hypothetical protein [Datura stramonium]
MEAQLCMVVAASCMSWCNARAVKDEKIMMKEKGSSSTGIFVGSPKCIGVLERCIRGFYLGYQGANKGSRHPRDENQGRNYEYIAELRRIQKLKGDLLELTRMVKDHEISIRHLEERMSHLASQLKSGVIAEVKKPLMENFTPSSEGVDEEDIEKDIEEMFFKESLETILLNNDGEGIEGLKEICHAIISLRSYSYLLKKLDLDLKN